ncbi:hypothetical protein EIP91_007758 [Steccherinum ochraceum]|uniref:DUF6533 domain-containing protein n=1 Tax=Steccherinum ochraceum TaxID=92696 RepID=A0A4R0RLI4_9APHY|nr:hypothetical protein EIP91_007758 [Steccherinum ochraceum]
MDVDTLWLAQTSAYFAVAISVLYLLEFFTSMDFELSFITRRRKFTWPMVVYFACRYLALLPIGIYLNTLVGSSNYGITSTSKVSNKCKVWTVLLHIYSFSSFTTAVLAMANLAIRTMGIWSRARRIVIPLTFGMLCLWAFVIVNTFISNHFPAYIRLILLIYFTVFDGVIFLLALCKLLRDNYAIGLTQLARHLIQDGAGYLLCSLAVNIFALTVPFMSKDAGISNTAILTAILSCRLVRRLRNFGTVTPGGPEIYLMTESSPRETPAVGTV